MTTIYKTVSSQISKTACTSTDFTSNGINVWNDKGNTTSWKFSIHDSHTSHTAKIEINEPIQKPRKKTVSSMCFVIAENLQKICGEIYEVLFVLFQLKELICCQNCLEN